ncbi:unnamed protein product [Ectocarpus sp. CCAP 1310/34]|nr:unnamed protein product [Ectocarpus sp. CCAP 1310/34]
MASSRFPAATDQWEKTSMPVCYPERNTGKWRLFLNFTKRKGDKAKRQQSSRFASREAALAGVLDLRAGWEYSHRGKLYKRKSRDSLGKLNAVEERNFKRQRLAGSDATRAGFTPESTLSRRERRSIESNEQHIRRIEDAMAEQDLASLLAPLPPSPIEGNAEVDARACTEGEDNQYKEEVSATQANRLWYQGHSALTVLKEERKRDLRQLQLTQQAKSLSDESYTTIPAVKAAEAKRFELLNEASRLRHESSLLRIAARVNSAGSRVYAASTILGWLRDFRGHGGSKRDSRGVHERDWIMSEEDLKDELVMWMRTQKRLTVKDVQNYINQWLFANEIGDLSRLLSYQVNLPVSMATTHSWMIALGCKYERATKSFYTDGHEKKDVVVYRGKYIDVKRKLALRQPLWVRVQRDTLTPEELQRLDGIKGPAKDFCAEVYDCVVEGRECIEFHVDLLRDNGSVDRFDDLRAELGPEGGHFSVRFEEAAALPCEHFHTPVKCKCNRKREDGWHMGNMNVNYGGKQKVLRDTVMTEGCLGPEEAKMYLSNGKWSTEFTEGAEVYDMKLKVGDTQTSTFAAGSPSPFFEWDAPRKDVTVARKAKRTSKAGVGVGAGDEGAADEAGTKPRDKIKEGGHILLLSPKCHPEVAGVGIEYSWGFSKQRFRRKYNDEVPKHLHANIEKSMCREKHLTIGRVRRFARRKRDYCRAYREKQLGAVDGQGLQLVEKMRDTQKAHRNILDMEPGFLGKQ